MITNVTRQSHMSSSKKVHEFFAPACRMYCSIIQYTKLSVIILLKIYYFMI